jgi:ABC-type uncharacterized transport system permease subunit
MLLQADTTSVGYQIGYQIGSWLPFIVVLVIFAAIIYNRYSFKKKG